MVGGDITLPPCLIPVAALGAQHLGSGIALGAPRASTPFLLPAQLPGWAAGEELGMFSTA